MFQYNKLTFFFFPMLFLLVGCAVNKKTIKRVRQYDGIEKSNVDLQEMVARLTQIPDVPLGFEVFQVVYDDVDVENVQIQYRLTKKNASAVDLVQLQKVYQADMELLGWNCLKCFNTEQSIFLLFNKPSGSYCQVAFDQDKILKVTLLQGNTFLTGN